MEPLEILIWDSPKLLMVCDKVEDNEFGPELERFSAQLLTTMKAHNGVGLAAPQVGVTKRMFVMKFPDHKNVPPIVVCNPTLVISGNAIPDREGCLSLPGIYEQVQRASHVNMQYREPNGKSVELLLDLWDARVAQHEYDHLDGLMFFDSKNKRPTYGARMSKQVSKRVLQNWEKEKAKRERFER